MTPENGQVTGDEIAPVEWTDPFSRNHASASWFSHKANAIWIDTPAVDNELDDVARHELNHFLIHASTPYGHLLDELDLRQSNLSTSLIFQYQDDLYCPVYEFAVMSLRESARIADKLPGSGFAEEARRIVIPWSRTVYLERLLEGLNLSSVRSALEGNALPFLEQFESGARELLPDEELFGIQATVPPPCYRQPIACAPQMEGPAYACPSGHWSADVKHHPLGAKHVFEGLAQFVERGIVDTSDSTVGHDYLSLYTATAMNFGVDRLESRDAFNTMITTFNAMCDLALFVPVGAVYGRLRPSITTWVDLQPAYRFLRALEVVAENEWWISDLTSDIIEFQTRVSRHLRWTAPLTFLELGAELKMPRFSRHRDACEMRLGRHDAFVDSSISQEARQLLKQHTPLIRLPHRDHTYVSSKHALAQIMAYFWSRLPWDMMLNPSIDTRKLLPPAVRYSRLFANIHSEEEMLQFILESVPALDLERFKSLDVLLGKR